MIDFSDMARGSPPKVSIVIFDSRAAVGSARAVSMSGRAEELSGAEVARGVAFFDTAARHGV